MKFDGESCATTLRRVGRFGLAAAFSLGLSLAAYAADSLSAYEEQLFFHAYESESRQSRIERLEERVFGQIQQGSLTERENRLLGTLGAVRQKAPAAEEPAAGPAPQPTGYTYTPPGSQPAQPAVQPRPQAPPKADATNYPTVIALEEQVLGQSFAHEDISVRLNRLETRAFNRTFPDKALIDRVDQLLARYPDAGQRAPAVAATEPGFSKAPDWEPNPEESTPFSGSSRDVYIKVDELERAVLGQAYPGNLITERLDNLESRLLGQTYKGQSVDARVDRLIRNFKSTAASNSGYQPRPGIKSRPGFRNPDGSYSSNYGNSYQPSSSRPPQNIQIGGGFYSNSTMRFSPELIDMLPPDARAAVMGPGANAGYGAQGYGTTVIQQGAGYPGIQTFGGNGGTVQYRSYVNTPGMTQSYSQSTTVIQPDGSQTIYSNQPPPGIVYTGNPAVLQSLNDLEIRMYGQVLANDPFPARLARLETNLMGQVYSGYPDEQRVANLQKAYQYQSLSRVLGQPGASQNGSGPTLGLPLTPSPQGPLSSPGR